MFITCTSINNTVLADRYKAGNKNKNETDDPATATIAKWRAPSHM